MEGEKRVFGSDRRSFVSGDRQLGLGTCSTLHERESLALSDDDVDG